MPGESGGGLQAEKVDQCGPREGTVSSVEDTVLSPSCICTLVRVSRQKMTLCGTWQEIAVSRDSKSVVRNTNSSRPL